jgi:nucleoside diphosphate kinase
VTIGNIERTLVIIKPDGIEKGLVGKVIARIVELGLVITRIQTKLISPEECKKLYPKTVERRNNHGNRIFLLKINRIICSQRTP